MAKARFRWDAFDDITVTALARTIGFVPEGNADSTREWLGNAVKRPTPEFVRAAKDVLVRMWLPKYDGTKGIVDRLIDAGIGPMGNPKSPDELARYVGKCRNAKGLQQCLSAAMLRFGDQDRTSDATPDDFVPRFAVLTPGEQPEDTRTPYDFQQDAWNSLSAHLAEAQTTGTFQGLLVMPTGAGKTYTAIHWLLKRIVARGQKVLWLVHRQELINQATSTFQKLARQASPAEKIRIRAVSGSHCASDQIDPSDHVIIASIFSLAYRPDIAAELLSDEKRFVVVDEAHHAPAKSYRDLIGKLKERQSWGLLGLTATPTRAAEGERPILTQLFGDRILYQISLKDLVLKGILAEPIPVRVQTGADIEAEITESDIVHLERFRDLGEELNDKIARLEGRNRTIVEHYISNKSKYGPTLIFAINVRHAALLADALRSRGIQADYVASYRPDGTEGEPDVIIQRFRDKEIDVLINVQILTEGVDVPGIQTVFLARPTMSEVLMRQMVGRALRGKKAGGTDKAYLVSFEDHWERFRDWASPFDLISDVIALAEPSVEEPEPVVEHAEMLAQLPWDIIHAAAVSLRDLPIHLKADVFEAVPHGSLVYAREDDGELVQAAVPIYEHQRPCWDALISHLEATPAPELTMMSGEQREAMFEEFFGDCDLPQASLDDVSGIVQHFAHQGERPEFHDLEGRRFCAPEEVARLILDQDLGERARTALLNERYTALAQAVYGELREYRAAVEDVLHELQNPDDSTARVRAVPIFEPRPDQQLTHGPTHDLEALLGEVLQEGATLIGVPSLKHVGKLEWTKRLVKGWYAYAYWDEAEPYGHGRIRCNSLLNSPDITEATIKFLLWHEYLHLHLKQGHTREFRRLERLWPSNIESGRELDTLNERFGVQYW